MAVVDALTMLIPAGLISASGDFPALQLHPRHLPSCAWVVSMLIPPAASATFSLAISTINNGIYRTIKTLVWPSATSGSRQVPIGVSGALAQILNNQSAWLRASVTLSGPLTLAGSWLSKPSDGGPGLGSRSYSLDNINML